MNYAVVLSGGNGTRAGLDIPKQYYRINNKPIFSFVTDQMEMSDKIDGYVIVASSEWDEFISEELEKSFGSEKFLGFARPGETRQLSILNGLVLLSTWAEEDDLVLIQDAARPNTSLEIICECFNLTENEDGAMPVLPMKDTVYLSKSGEKIDSLLNRNEIFAGQAPECFRYGRYLQANVSLSREEILKVNGSSEPAILQGMNIKLFPGDENNFKITTENDLKRFIELQKDE